MPQLENLYVKMNGSDFSFVRTFPKTEDVHGLLGSASSVPSNYLSTTLSACSD